LKVKSIILLIFLIVLPFSSFFQLLSDVSVKIGTEKEDFQIKTAALEEGWEIQLDTFGKELVIDSNNCIYVMSSEHYHCAFGCRYYGDVIIMRYNSLGDQLWSVRLEGLWPEYSGVVVDSVHNLYLTSLLSNNTLNNTVVLIKFNSSGAFQWQQTFTIGDNGHLTDIAIDSADNIYLYGTSDSYEEFRFDMFIVKYNSLGEQLWFRIYGENNTDYYTFDIEIDSHDNIIISGHNSQVINQTYQHYWWLKCYNQSGDLKWNISRKDTRFYTFSLDSSNNIISFKYTHNILKFNDVGSLLWKWKSKVSYRGVPYIAFDSFDDIYVATTKSIPEDHDNTDLYLFKLNSSGKFKWYLTWGGSDDDTVRAIDIDINNNIYLLSNHVLIKNPINNGKSLTNENLWNFYITVLIICLAISGISLYLIIRRKIPKVLKNKS